MSLSREEIIRMARACGINYSEAYRGLYSEVGDGVHLDDMFSLLNAAYAAGVAAEREAARTKKYVPMTDAEWEKVMWTKIDKNHSMMTYEQFIEAAVIRRAIAQGAKLEVEK